MPSGILQSLPQALQSEGVFPFAFEMQVVGHESSAIDSASATRAILPPSRRHKELKARIGFSVFNLLNHFNPRDVQSDIDSDRYSALFNGVGRTFRGKFVLEF